MLAREEQLLATGKITVLFKKFALPGIIGLLFIGLQPMIDGAVLGNYVCADALASVSVFVPVYTFMSALAVVIGVWGRLLSVCLWGIKTTNVLIRLLQQHFVFCPFLLL